MTVRYNINAYTPEGTNIGSIYDLTTLNVTLGVNNPGLLTFDCRDDSFFNLSSKDTRFEVWRSHDNKPAKKVANTHFLLRQPTQNINQGVYSYTYEAIGALTIPLRKIIAAYADTAGSSKAGAADDIMKAIVSEAMTNNIWNLYRSNSVFSVASDETLGPAVDKSFSWRKVLDVLKELHELSTQLGTPVYFDVVVSASNQLVFQTYIQQRGRDARYGYSNRPVVFSENKGNLDKIRLAYNWKSEVTGVYIGGRGEGTDREVVFVEDASRQAETIFNSHESFYSNTTTNVSTDQLEADGNSALSLGAPKIEFSGEIYQTPDTLFMEDWDFGDYVTAYVGSRSFNCRINTLGISYSDGQETIQARLVS